MPVIRNFAIGLLATAAALAHVSAHSAEAAQKDPKTGKNCVIFVSADMNGIGQTRMIYRNTCPSAFQIRIQAADKVRQGSIEPGTSEKPSKAYVTCKADDRCESAKWLYE